MAVNPEKVRSSPVNTHATVITEPGNEQRLLQAETLLARTLEIEPWHLVLLKAKANSHDDATSRGVTLDDELARPGRSLSVSIVDHAVGAAPAHARERHASHPP